MPITLASARSSTNPSTSRRISGACLANGCQTRQTYTPGSAKFRKQTSDSYSAASNLTKKEISQGCRGKHAEIASARAVGFIEWLGLLCNNRLIPNGRAGAD